LDFGFAIHWKIFIQGKAAMAWSCHSPAASAKVKNECSYTSTLHIPSWHTQNNFVFIVSNRLQYHTLQIIPYDTHAYFSHNLTPNLTHSIVNKSTNETVTTEQTYQLHYAIHT
jgi:hypothetical protein